MKFNLAVLSTFFVAVASLITPAIAAQATPPVSVALVGDSTVTDQYGWGAGFRAFVSESATLENFSVSGTSSKSFRDEGHWKKVAQAQPTWVLIQVGHNDQPGKGASRETDPNSTYPENLSRYIDEVKAWGGHPILVTSLTRRTFGPDRKIRSSLTPYALAALRVAQEKNSPSVDLHALSIAAMNALGPELAMAYNYPRPESAIGRGPDLTHLSELGANETGKLIAESIKKSIPELGHYLKNNNSNIAPSNQRRN